MASILLVEDDTNTRDMLQRTLVSDGHEVTAVGDGSEALQQAARTSYELVVSDISMPELDGVTMAETLLTANPQLPVILMSAISDELARASSLPGNSVRVISKPVSLDHIRAEVKSALAG